MSGRSWSLQDKEKLRDGWLARKSVKWLSGYLNRTESSIRTQVSLMGLPKRLHHRMTPEQVERRREMIRRLVASGMGDQQIADTVGLAKCTVFRYRRSLEGYEPTYPKEQAPVTMKKCLRCRQEFGTDAPRQEHICNTCKSSSAWRNGVMVSI